MGGNYPDGVSGLEYAIAGPDREWADVREVACSNGACDVFDVPFELTLDLEAYDGQEWGFWNCEDCGVEQEYSGEIMFDEDDRIGEY